MKRKFKPNLNHIKIVLGTAMLMLNIAGVISAWIEPFYPGVVTFALLSIVTLDYIRVVRKELQLGPWYKLDNIE